MIDIDTLPPLSAFPHRIPVEIRFNDIDILGHVNNTVYFSFYDTGKAWYFKDIVDWDIDWRKVETVIANVECTYMEPLLFGEDLVVGTRCEAIHDRSFHILQVIADARTGRIKSACRTVMVSFDPATQKSMNKINDIMRSILERESQAILNIPVTDDYGRAVDLIVEHVNRRGGKLICSGMGKAGQIAMNIATTFCSTGTPAVFLHPSEAQHGDLGIIQKNDLLLLLSNSGKTREIVELVQLARVLNPEIPIIVITGNPESQLGTHGDVTLSTGNSPEVCPLGLTPTTSTTMMTVMGDVLVVATMQKIGFTKEEYAKRHHGGYLGHKSSGQSGNPEIC